MDLYELNRQLDKAKSHLFQSNNAAFFGSILCSLTHLWDDKIPTACVDSTHIRWNPDWFMSMGDKQRQTVLRHELEHVARMHGIRRGSRNAETWNYACDYVINNGLDDENYDFTGLDPLLDQRFSGMCEEQVYDILCKENFSKPDFKSDLGENPHNEHELVETVTRAVQASQLAGKAAGSAPGNIEAYLDTFLNPVVPWDVVLREFFTTLVTDEYTWARPNRRYTDMYLPSQLVDDRELKHLAYYLDTSGSITDEQLTRFNSEVRYLFDEFKPELLTLIQFDRTIRQVDEFHRDKPFEALRVVGRGGTSLRDVRADILTRQPTAAIIFSDLECNPMEPLPISIPIIWVVVDNPTVTPTFGRVTHITI